MRGRLIVVVAVGIAVCIGLLGTGCPASAEGPNIDRCIEYLNPYTPTEWERCIGNEFGKFPEMGTELRDAYVQAPHLGNWPEPQVFAPGFNAPLVDYPFVDGTGRVYAVPPGLTTEIPPYTGSEQPSVGYWWQQEPTFPAQSAPQANLYTAWRDYWVSDGATGYGGWQVPGGYTVPPW